ncbi:class I SAM-dependent methyltransferase [Marinobacter mobilis]|nr:class I SAM-dependent methyltransferase [Marinobacter mobilis]
MMKLTESQVSFVASVISEQTPQEVLQLGLGSMDSTLSVCEALDAIDNSALTLITPTVGQHSTFIREMNKRQDGLLGELVELIRTPADEVLPDFYFQNRSIDLAIINDTGQFDQALVALYYVDKLLASKGTIILNNADNPMIGKLCRYLVSERGYTVQSTLGQPKQTPLAVRILRAQFNRAPGFIQSRIERLINPELLTSGDEPGLDCSTIALVKPVQEGEVDMDFDTLLESIMNESAH